MVGLFDIKVCSERRPVTVLAITNDSSALCALTQALTSECMFAIAATPAATSRLSKQLRFDVVIILGDVSPALLDRLLADVRAFDAFGAPDTQLLDVIDPRIVIHTTERVLRARDV